MAATKRPAPPPPGRSPSPAAALTPAAAAGTLTTLAAVPTTVTVGHPVTLTVSVRATITGLPAPAGTVTFRDGARVLGTAALSGGTARLTLSHLTAGTHRFNAYY